MTFSADEIILTPFFRVRRLKNLRKLFISVPFISILSTVKAFVSFLFGCHACSNYLGTFHSWCSVSKVMC